VTPFTRIPRESRANSGLSPIQGVGPEEVADLVGVRMNQDAQGLEKDDDVAPDRPPAHIFEVGLKSPVQVLDLVSRPAITADLGQAGDSGLQQMPMGIAIIDIPKQQWAGT
jgi:hypothetical protein